MPKIARSEPWQYRFVSHWVQQEAPTKVNALLTRFLAGSARR